MKLCSVADIKMFLDKTDSDHDSLLDRMVSFVSQTLESSMNGRLLKKEQRVKYFNSEGRIYLLPAFPVDTTAVFSVTLDDDTQIKNDDYYIYDETGLVEFDFDTTFRNQLNDTMVPCPKGVKITWTGGYTEGTGTGVLAVPDDLTFACIMQTSFMFRRRKDMGTSYILMPDGAASIPVKEGLLPQVRDIVERYSLTYV